MLTCLSALAKVQVHAALERGNHLSGNAFVDGIGDDAGMEESDGAACGALPVGVVQRGGLPVPDGARAIQAEARCAVGREADRDLLRRAVLRAEMAVGRVGFFDCRSEAG